MLLANVIAKENSFEFNNEGKGNVCVVSDLQSSEKISQDYFNNFSLKPFNSLSRAVESSIQKNVIAMSYVDGVIYFSSYGKALAQITRAGVDTVIFNSEVGLKNASGYPKEGDIITIRTEYGKMSLRFDERLIFSNKIYLKPFSNEEVSPQSKKITFFVAISLLAFLIIAIVVGVNKKNRDDLKNKYAGVLTEAETSLSEAINLSSSDPERSRELFKLSEEKIKSISDIKISDSRLTDIRNKITDSRESILGEYAGNPELFLDLSLLSSGFNGEKISVSGDSTYVLDLDGKKIVKIEIETKKSKVVAGPSVIDEVKDIASYDDTVYIQSEDGIHEVGDTKNKIIEKTWNDESFIRIFGGNVYVLDKLANQIYRYQASGNSFGEKQNWLSSKTIVNFNDAKMWGLDGAVYVLYPNSKILKFSQGSPQNFRLSGIVPEIGNVDALYADPNNSYLYLLDIAGKRVVVVDKKGAYKAQYSDDKIGQAVNLVVSEKDKKIILLTGEKLMQMEIRHLN